MPFVPVPNTVEVQSVYELDLQVVENTMWFEHTGPVEAADVTALLVAVRDAIETNLLPLLSTTIKLVKLIGTLMDAVDSLSLVLAVSPAATGGNSAAPAPSNVSYAIQFASASRGRGTRGRNYVPVLQEAEITQNTINPTLRSQLVAAYQAVGGAGADAGFQHVIAHRFSGSTIVAGKKVSTPLTVGVTFPVTTYLTADGIIDSQRRRLPGRGR